MGDLWKEIFSVFTRRSLTLEEALPNIWWDPQLRFGYQLDNETKIETPAYILPVGFDSRIPHGMFSLNKELVKTPFGLTSTLDDLHCYFNEQQNLILFDPHENTKILSLPLDLTEFQIPLNFYKDGGYVAHPDNPFTILGLGAAEYKYPFILAHQNKKQQTKFWSFYYSDSGMGIFKQTNKNFEEEDFNKFLHNLLSGNNPSEKAYFLPPPLELNGSGKSSAMMKFTGNTEEIPLVLEESLDWQIPRTIVDFLDRKVIGQDEAKKEIATAFSVYMTRMNHANDNNKDLLLPKGNVMLIGPSGVGKTFMTDLLVERADLPRAKTSITAKSAAGYVDEGLSSVFESIVDQTNDFEPYAVVFIDEFDKVVENQRGFFGEKQQDELIGWLGGTTLRFGGSNSGKKSQKISTKNILFVTAGAFEGIGGDRLVNIITKRRGQKLGEISGFGRTSYNSQDSKEKEHILSYVTPEDLVKYGLKKELIRRIPFIAALNYLTVEDKIRILNESEQSVLQSYYNYFELLGYQLEIDPAIPEIIAKKSPPEIGASGLDSICENLFFKIIYDPKLYSDAKDTITITPELAEELLDE